MRLALPVHTSGPPHPGKQRRPYLEPIAFPKDNPPFAQPPAQHSASLALPLAVIAPQVAAEALASGTLAFHAVGDTGGINGTETQVAVAEAMEAQITAAEHAKHPAPGFLFHLGDVIYYDGQASFYEAQFYDPYKHYPREIFAIPGNHDGDTRRLTPKDAPPEGPSLAGFMANFCDTQRRKPFPYRSTMTQPHCWWRLDAPFVTILGLYSNIEGTLDARGRAEQQHWLEHELGGVPKDRFLLVAVHHPPYSLDTAHGGTPDIASALDRAMHTTGRAPHAVFSAHVHSYQRFSRTLDAALGGHRIPYLVAGAGGYANSLRALHRIQTDPATGKPPPDGTKCVSHIDPELALSIDSHNDTAASFLRVTVTATLLTIEAFAVPIDGTPPPARPFDHVRVGIDGGITR